MDINSHEILPPALSQETLDTIKLISDLLQLLLGRIANKKLTIEHFRGFVDWLLDLSYEDREELFEIFVDGHSTLLKVVPTLRHLNISPLKGSKTIHDSKGVFSHIDPLFRKNFENEKGKPTSGITVLFYEVTTQQSTAKDLFASLCPNIEKLCLTQHQILNFITLYRSLLLEKDQSTLFLCKSEKGYYAVSIYSGKYGSFEAHLLDIQGLESVWDIFTNIRVVAPELK